MTPSLTTKAAEIRAGLEGVTPGPWRFGLSAGQVVCDVDRLFGAPVTIRSDVAAMRTVAAHNDESLANAAHIARLDPATVLAFLDERAEHLALIEQQAAELAALRLSEAEAWQQANNGHARAEAAESTIATQSERIAVLEGALRPLAARIDEIEQVKAIAMFAIEGTAAVKLTLLRDARAALTEGGAEHG